MPGTGTDDPQGPDPGSSRGLGTFVGVPFKRLFLVPALGQTFAELGVGTKGELSHRARAMQAIKPRLLAYLAQLGR